MTKASRILLGALLGGITGTALSLVLLTGCSLEVNRPYLQCTVDDTISFTASEVRTISIEGNVLILYRANDAPVIRRRMLPGETCIRVEAIDWELAK